MIIDRRLGLHLLAALPVVLAVWLAILAVVLRLGGAAPGVLVVLPQDGFVAALPKGAAITGASRFSLTLKDPGPVAELYAAGAWLVLPAGLEACIPSFLQRPAPGQ